MVPDSWKLCQSGSIIKIWWYWYSCCAPYYTTWTCMISFFSYSQSTQFHRGGGTMCMSDPHVWKEYTNIIRDIETCGPIFGWIRAWKAANWNIFVATIDFLLKLNIISSGCFEPKFLICREDIKLVLFE